MGSQQSLNLQSKEYKTMTAAERTKLQEALSKFYNKDKWNELVNAVNEIADESEAEIDIDPATERMIDEMAINSAWIYRRLGNEKRYKAIRKALGYNAH